MIDFSTMSPAEVRKVTMAVVYYLRASSDISDAYYRVSANGVPVIYADVATGVLQGVSIVLRVDQIAKLAERLAPHA